MAVALLAVPGRVLALVVPGPVAAANVVVGGGVDPGLGRGRGGR